MLKGLIFKSDYFCKKSNNANYYLKRLENFTIENAGKVKIQKLKVIFHNLWQFQALIANLTKTSSINLLYSSLQSRSRRAIVELHRNANQRQY